MNGIHVAEFSLGSLAHSFKYAVFEDFTSFLINGCYLQSQGYIS